MNCPNCQHPESKVLDTRASGDGIRRRRQCLGCGARFSTIERIERKPPLVVKKDGKREPFDRDKVLGGLRLACRKRSVSAQAIEASADRIEQWAYGAPRGEVTSQLIGKRVLEELKHLDLVAYARFASVYLRIDTPQEFLHLLQPLVGAIGGGEE